MKTLFHCAYNVHDLETTRRFYADVLGCVEGRSTDKWVDFNFFGHQVSMHLGEPFQTRPTGKVGDHMVPMPHLGVVLEMLEWEALAKRLQDAEVEFIIEPSIRFKGQPGEQATMFFLDPSGNPIEVKGFADMDGLFAS